VRALAQRKRNGKKRGVALPEIKKAGYRGNPKEMFVKKEKGKEKNSHGEQKEQLGKKSERFGKA